MSDDASEPYEIKAILAVAERLAQDFGAETRNDRLAVLLAVRALAADIGSEDPEVIYQAAKLHITPSPGWKFPDKRDPNAAA